MNLSPDSSDEVRRRVSAAYRLKRRAQLEVMQTEARDLAVAMKHLGARLSLLAGQVNVMLIENRSDDTTVVLRLPRDPPYTGPV